MRSAFASAEWDQISNNLRPDILLYKLWKKKIFIDQEVEKKYLQQMVDNIPNYLDVYSCTSVSLSEHGRYLIHKNASPILTGLKKQAIFML